MKIFRYDITDSTNTRAREYAAKTDAELPAVFIAEGQTAGRGRRGRSFDSEEGKGLYITFLFKPRGRAQDAVKITIRAAVALSRALRRACGISVGIKWVNDIIADGKKLAGILTEGQFGQNGEFSYAVCGMGVNLQKREFPAEIAGIATSVEHITGIAPDKEKLIECLISEFFRECDEEQIIKEYRERSVLIGESVEIHRISGEVFAARVIDITDGGGLLVQRTGGETEELISAEVSVRR